LRELVDDDERYVVVAQHGNLPRKTHGLYRPSRLRHGDPVHIQRDADAMITRSPVRLYANLAYLTGRMVVLPHFIAAAEQWRDA